MVEKLTTKIKENSSVDLEAAIFKKNDFVEDRVKEYFLGLKGNINSFENVIEENGEYFVSVKFDKRDKTFHGFLARGLKISPPWQNVYDEVSAINGIKNYRVTDGQIIKVPVRLLMDTALWEEEFQKIKDQLEAETKLKEGEKEKEQEEIFSHSKYAREELDLQLQVYTPVIDATYEKPVEQYDFQDEVQDPLSASVIEKFFPKPEIAPVLEKVLPENFEDFLFSYENYPADKKGFVYRANLTLKKAKKASLFLVEKNANVMFEIKENLEKLLQDSSYVLAFEKDSVWAVPGDIDFTRLSPGAFDTLCTRVRCGTTNQYLRSEKQFDIKENGYELFDGLQPWMKQMTYIFARDFLALEIQCYPDEKVSFTLSGGKEKRKNKSSNHNTGKAVDLRTNNISVQKLEQIAKYLRQFQRVLDEKMQRSVTEFLQEDKRLRGYKNTEDQTGPHLHFAITEDIPIEILEEVSAQVREEFENNI